MTHFQLGKTDNVDWATRKDFEEIAKYYDSDYLVEFENMIKYADDAFRLQDHILNKNNQSLDPNVKVYNPYVKNFHSFTNIFNEFSNLEDGHMVIAFDTYPLLSTFPANTFSSDVAAKSFSGNFATISPGSNLNGSVRNNEDNPSDMQLQHKRTGDARATMNRYFWSSGEYIGVTRSRCALLSGSSWLFLDVVSEPGGMRGDCAPDSSSYIINEWGTHSETTARYLRYRVSKRIRNLGGTTATRSADGEWWAMRRIAWSGSISSYPGKNRSLTSGWCKYKIDKTNMRKVLIYGIFNVSGGEVDVEISPDNSTFTSLTEIYEEDIGSDKMRFFMADINSNEAFVQLTINGSGGSSGVVKRFCILGV